ncbi:MULTISPECIES: glycine cleavage system aminomethyltransferase GcvT [unclassified Pseudomonas]|uniref:glycine cleavage system aminomethyltransferase GcvT n=1 Tax=unclassified Pseudomonas TaxID=196821 RepID=UPI000BD56C4A|nr:MULTISPECIES: glycine cleavage system aminomethyltransferase GcvT [unclassified Pseudomonas]PVZ11244.1 aminomethyltransferase [Pseudomonas sp. URIL14HWK12:I12]PVZ22242.1 aminomethyltransferase [Pseudomonas sp. URIL14HWK12:I10]PVZ31634.1 aminomethyltransferase [Pseudomonas sp. URIL14HWK12:I11]SNZ16665.1 aminomethyltransferase [Pseudomonas sp. URIL14HWK12:I9]
MSDTLKRTPLHALHLEQGARMVPFAGYDMPVQYPLGVMKEHLHTRAQAGLFDVSHMGQIRLRGQGVAQALEQLVPVDIVDLPVGLQRYALFTNEEGGILDDLMVARLADDELMLVVNAACKEADLAHLRAHLGAAVTIEPLFESRALLALQGPAAVTALARLAPEVASMTFMQYRPVELAGQPCYVSRSGYTGEDGYEISVPAEAAETFARRLLEEPEVALIGLGARDSLRLEAGLCLYGHDMNTQTTPAEASLGWAISKARRAGGARAGGFPGADRLGAALTRKRVGLLPQERTPVREGCSVTDAAGQVIGQVCSGGFGPSLGGPLAMAYLAIEHCEPGTLVNALVRGKAVPMKVVNMPFVPTRYYRGKA